MATIACLSKSFLSPWLHLKFIACITAGGGLLYDELAGRMNIQV
jgi:hypothetical protein